MIFVGPIDVFPKNHDSEHDFHDQHVVNGQKSCSIFVILSDPDDFRDKNHDFSARGTMGKLGGAL